MNTKKIFGIAAITLLVALVLVGSAAAIGETYYIADNGTGSGCGTPSNPVNAESFFQVYAGSIYSPLTSSNHIIIPAGKTVTIPFNGSTIIANNNQLNNLKKAQWENKGTVVVGGTVKGAATTNLDAQLKLATENIGGTIIVDNNINASSANINVLKSASIEGRYSNAKIDVNSFKIGSTESGKAVSNLNVTLKNISIDAPVTVASKNNTITMNNADVTVSSGSAINVDSNAAGAVINLLNKSEVTGNTGGISFATNCTIDIKNSTIKTTSGNIFDSTGGNNSTITIDENSTFTGGKLYDSNISATTDKNKIIVTGQNGMNCALGQNGAQKGTVVVNGDFSLNHDYTYGNVTNTVPAYLQDRNIIINGKINLNGRIFVVGNTTVKGNVTTNSSGFGGAMIPVNTTKLTIAANSTVEIDTNTSSSAIKTEIENVIGTYTPFNLFTYEVNHLDNGNGYLINTTDIKDGSTVLVSSGIKISTSGGSSGTSVIALSGNSTYAVPATLDSSKNLKITGSSNCKVILSSSTGNGIEGTLTILAPVEIQNNAEIKVGSKGTLTIGSASSFKQNGAKITVNNGTLEFTGGNVTMNGDLDVEGKSAFAVNGGNLTLNPDCNYLFSNTSSYGYLTVDIVGQGGSKGKILGGATIYVNGNVSLSYDSKCKDNTVYINSKSQGDNKTVEVKISISPNNTDLLHVQLYEVDSNKNIIGNVNVSNGTAYLNSGNSTNISYTPFYSSNIFTYTNANGMFITAGDKNYVLIVFNDDGTFQYFTNQYGTKLLNGNTYTTKNNLNAVAVASTKSTSTVKSSTQKATTKQSFLDLLQEQSTKSKKTTTSSSTKTTTTKKSSTSSSSEAGSTTSFTGVMSSGNIFTFKNAEVVTKAYLPKATTAKIVMKNSSSGLYDFDLTTNGIYGTLYFQVPLSAIMNAGITVKDVVVIGADTTYLGSNSTYAFYCVEVMGSGNYTIGFKSTGELKTATKSLENTAVEENVTTEKAIKKGSQTEVAVSSSEKIKKLLESLSN